MEGDRMSRVSWSWLLSIAVLGLGGCGGGDDSSKPAASPPPAPPPAAAAAPAPPAPPTPPPAAAPTAALDCKNPTGELRGDKERGAKLYAQTCASCHGATGHGDGPASKGLNPPPANHTDPGRMGKLTDADIYHVICGGGASVGKSPLMAAWGPVVGDQGIRDLIAHIRTLSGT
jgi:mono/diheme cytochrome c family protein